MSTLRFEGGDNNCRNEWDNCLGRMRPSQLAWHSTVPTCGSRIFPAFSPWSLCRQNKDHESVLQARDWDNEYAITAPASPRRDLHRLDLSRAPSFVSFPCLMRHRGSSRGLIHRRFDPMKNYSGRSLDITQGPKSGWKFAGNDVPCWWKASEHRRRRHCIVEAKARKPTWG